MSPLSSAAQRWVLDLARASLASLPLPERPPDLAAELRQSRGVFVTLRNHGDLRGCVGRVTPDLALPDAVAEMTQAAAHEDPRFDPVTPEEVPDIHIEISILSPFFPIKPTNIVPGLHGLLVRKGYRQGLLLPQVASGRGWDAERFLAETCRKAGLPRDAWKKGATVEAFTTEVFEE